MATSSTTSFNLDLVQLVEEAFERCGSELKSGYDLRTARRSLNLLFADWANRGLNMWTFEQGTITLFADRPTYNLPADTVDLMEVYLRTGTGTTQLDKALNRIGLSTYASIPSKNMTGDPQQVLIDRVGTPTITVWPVPTGDNVTATLVYWRLRRIQDAGTGANTMDVPFRFLPALVAGLAYYLALKLGALDRVQLLKDQYDEAWVFAAEEDREKASIRFVPQRAHR